MGKQGGAFSLESLESLLNMDWGSELAPLVDFLNLKLSKFEGLAGAVQKYNASAEKEVDPFDFMDLCNEMYFVLESFSAMRTSAAAEDLGAFLSEKLVNTTNDARIMDLHTKQVRVFMEENSVIAGIWMDFICVFLSMENWRDVLGICLQCKKVFAKKRKDQIYDREGCRGKASYARHKEARRATRRERYYRGKRL